MAESYVNKRLLRTWVVCEFARMNEVVTKPGILLGVEDVNRPVNHASDPGQFGSIRVIAEPNVKRYDMPDV